MVSDTKKGALKHANSGDASEQTVDPRQQRVIDEVIAELADLEENGPTPAARGGRGGRGRGPWVGGRGGQRRRQESSEDSSESSEEDEGTECWEGGHRRRRDHLPQGLADARKYGTHAETGGWIDRCVEGKDGCLNTCLSVGMCVDLGV